MAHSPLPILEQRGFGETLRRDAWWLPNVPVFILLSFFLVYATWAAFQGAYYTYGPYLSPFYSPEIWGSSSHALLGPKPAWWPSWLIFSPALVILPFPALFRFTCYYYRGSYYKAFWADPPSCAVGEPRKKYLGERTFPLVLQNAHRYFLPFALLLIVFLAYDAYKAYWFTDAATGATTFGIGVGTLILTANVIALAGYTLGCHSLRHLVGGMMDRMSGRPIRKAMYQGCSKLNGQHMQWAWTSLVLVGFSDIYIRLCAMGIWTDWRIL
jgi:hypothetical protein